MDYLGKGEVLPLELLLQLMKKRQQKQKCCIYIFVVFMHSKFLSGFRVFIRLLKGLFIREPCQVGEQSHKAFLHSLCFNNQVHYSYLTPLPSVPYICQT